MNAAAKPSMRLQKATRKPVARGAAVAKKTSGKDGEKAVEAADSIKRVRAKSKNTAAKPRTAAERNAGPIGYSEMVKKLAEDFGVKVGPTQSPDDTHNPYRLPRREADKVLKRTGILTADGKLGALFK